MGSLTLSIKAWYLFDAMKLGPTEFYGRTV